MSALSSTELRVALIDHWQHRADREAIEGDLARRGRPLDALSLEDLAPHDQLHAGGLEATRLFADWVGIAAGARVLDLGAGLGGAARFLARQHGCRVTALDLSPALTTTGAALTGWLGLGDRVTHLAGELGTCPLEETFELIWIQHLDIHLPHKPAFYGACRPLAAPTGRLVWHDWLAGPGGPPHWPLPWSRDGALSFLATEAELRALLPGAGFRLTRLEGLTEGTLGWYRGLERALERALARLPADAPTGSRAAHLSGLLTETRAVLQSLAEDRLRPFFGEAVPE